MPDDYGHPIADTAWDRIESRPLTEMSPQQWQEWKSGLVKVAVWKQYRLKFEDGSKQIFINPTPDETSCEFETRDGVKTKMGLVFEYVSKNWAEDENGVGKSAITTNNDVIRLDADIMEAEVKWRLLRALSRPYADEKFEAEQLINTALAQAGTPGSIVADGTRQVPHPNIPETDVGITT